MKRPLALAALFVPFMTGCPGEGPEVDYFPLVPGATKYMKVYSRQIVDTDTQEVTGIRPVTIVRAEKDLPEIGKVWVVETPRDSARSTYTYYRKDKGGVTQIVPLKGREATEVRYLSYPLTVGKQWYDTESQRETFTVVAQETLEVQAGTYPNCFKIAVVSMGADWAMHQWFAPGIGPVKWESRAAWEKEGVKHELVRTAELVRYDVPAESDWDEGD